MDPMPSLKVPTLAKPADHGLTHLGVVMEALGWMRAVVAVTIVLTILSSASSTSDVWGNGAPVSDLSSRVFVAALVFFAESLLLALAGRGLAGGSAQAAWIYVIGGGIAALTFVSLFVEGSTFLFMSGAYVVALCEPVLVGVALLRGPIVSGELVKFQLQSPSDGGGAGLASLMFCGAAFELVAAFWSFEFGRAMPEIAGPLPVFVLVFVLVTRAALQALAARRLRLGESRFARIYTRVGKAGAVLFLLTAVFQGDREMWIFSCGGAAILFAWPYVVGCAIGRLQAESLAPASDRGLLALGWLLLFLSAPGAVTSWFGLLIAYGYGVTLSAATALSAFLVLAQLWTAYEVLTLSSRMRLASICYVALGALTMWATWGETTSSEISTLFILGANGFQVQSMLVVPCVSLLLIVRASGKLGASR